MLRQGKLEIAYSGVREFIYTSAQALTSWRAFGKMFYTVHEINTQEDFTTLCVQ